MSSTYSWVPLANIQTEGYSTPDVEVAVATMQGKRRKHEDYYAMNPYRGFYGVFDGHGGFECASYLRDHLPDAICPPSSTTNEGRRVLFSDEKDEYNNRVHTDIQKACLHLDHKIVREQKMQSGSTAVFVKHDSVRQRVHIGNVGDSRFLWVDVDKPNAFEQPLKDHKPNVPDEEKRIKQAGSGVFNGRVCGNLAVSRAFGDEGLKRATLFESFADHEDAPLFKSLDQQPVIALPDCTTSSTHDHKLALLFSDGLLESMPSNESIVQSIHQWKQQKYDKVAWQDLKSEQLAECAQTVIREALEEGSSDNMTLMIIYFRTGASIVPTFGKRKHLNPSFCLTGAHYRHWTDYVIAPVTAKHHDSDWFTMMKTDVERYVDSRDVPLIRAPSPKSLAPTPLTPVIPETESPTLIMELPATEPKTDIQTQSLSSSSPDENDKLG